MIKSKVLLNYISLGFSTSGVQVPENLAGAEHDLLNVLAISELISFGDNVHEHVGLVSDFSEQVNV